MKQDDSSAGLDRVLTALALGRPDKAPFHAYESPENAIRQFGRKVHEIYLDPLLLPQAMLHTARLYQNDIIYMRPAETLAENEEAVAVSDGVMIRDKRTHAAIGRVLADTKTILPVHPLAPPDVRENKDIEKAMPVTGWRELLQQPVMQSLQPYVAAFKGRRFLFGFAGGQTANEFIRRLGFETALLATITDPGLCRAIMERRAEVQEQHILALQAMGADGIYMGDASASCSLFSPETYRALFLPFHRRAIDFIHAHGMKALLHICGRISPILEDMAGSGADVIESLDAPSAGGDMDLADAKRRVGRRVCLKGNLDAVHLLQPGPPEKIYQACLAALRAAGPSGYILSTEQVTRETPPEHILAMVQARDDFAGMRR